MENNIPYVVHEGIIVRMERTITRLWVVIIILIIALLGTNAAWLYYESQFETFTVTQENEDGYNNFIGNDGDIYNGEGKTDDQRKTPQNWR